MLELLHIRNFAIIDSLELEFDRGLTALTGETGAGKSILLDAIKLIAGDRADSDSIRSGCDRAEISAHFDLADAAPARDWLAESDMLDGDDCVIRRRLAAGGRSKAFINGSSATLTQLRALCDRLIDIHGQHEHQSLQQARVQRELLDGFVSEDQLLASLRGAFDTCRELEARLEQARSGAQEREQRIDLLRLYCAELDELGAASGEAESLQIEYRRLANAGALLDKTAAIVDRLYDNDELNLQAILSQCVADLAELRQSDASLAASHDLINAAAIQLDEAAAELRRYRDTIELDDARLEAVNERIAALQSLARKHRVGVEELPRLTESLAGELATLESDAFDLDAIDAELEQARQAYRTLAGELSQKRISTANQLSREITAVMQELGMQGGSFAIEVVPGETFSASGLDTIRYLVSANPGQPPRPLSRVASGGELSRISLAIQVIMSESSRIPTLIFDEVDAGVGGGVAEIVGNKLRLLGRDRQVLCVTHLPQVASQAHHHYRVDKSSDAGETRTAVTVLDSDARREEIARMLGGVEITERTRAHASEMIAANE